MPQSQKGFAFILVPIVAVLLVALAASAYVLKAPANPPASPSSTPQPENQSVPADWLTYQNQTYFYQISYPPFFHAQGDNEPPYPPPPAGMSFTHRWDNNEHCDFGILAFNDPDGFSGEIENIRQQGRDTESQATIDGITALVFDTQGGDAISRSYYLIKNGIHYRFGYNYRPAAKYSQDCADIVQQMVSSFSFLE